MSEELREAGSLEVHVTHVRGDSKWLKLYIQFDRFALQRIESAIRSIRDELEHMQGYVHQCQLPIGSSVCIRSRNEWLRGKVTAWTPANQQTVVVKYIDYGHEEVVKVNNLRKYENLFEIEPVAVECFLADIQSDDSGIWPPKAVDLCHKLVCYKDNIFCNVIQYFECLPIVRVLIGNTTLAQTLLAHSMGISIGSETRNTALTSYTRQSTPPGYSESINPGYQMPANSYLNPSPPLNYNSYPMLESFTKNILDPQVHHQVCVSHIDRLGKFYIQLAVGELERQTLKKSLLMHISSHSLTPIMSYVPGTPCIAFCNEEQAYQRATIINAVGLDAQVFFVDSGIKEQKPVSELRVIPNHFVTIPVQAYECTLGPQLPSFDINLFSEIVAGKILQCLILSHMRGHYVVCLYYNNKNLIEIMNTRYSPVTPLPGYRYVKLPTKRSFQVQTTLVISPNEIYFQLHDNVDQVLALMEQIHNYYVTKTKGVRIEVDQCVVGSAISCYHAADNRFFRAEILEKPLNGLVKVQLVDYGNCVTASLSEIRVLEPNFLALPAQAIKVSLFGIENIPEIVLNSQATARKLEDLTINRTLIAEIMNKISDKMYSVLLRLTDDNGKNLVINYILEEEVNVIVPCITEIEQIEVTNYDGPQDFFGQLSNVPIDVLENFVVNLHKHYSSLPPTQFNPSVGQYVCAKFSENEMFYRAKILSTQTANVEVLYIDYGNKEIRGLDNIFPLTTEFAKLPQMGIHCAFSDIPAHISHDNLSELMPDSTIEVQIVGEIGGIKQVKLTNHSSNATLLKLWKKPEPKRLPYNQPSIPLGAVEPVTVMDVTSFTKFSCQLQRNVENLDQMMASLDSYYKSLKSQDKILQNPMIGGSCVAKYSFDGIWYRARISDVPSPEKLNVYFVDYGNSELVSSCDVKQILDEYMKLPLFAVQCSLSEVTDENPDDVKRFKEEVLDETFNAIFTGQDPLTKLHKVELKNSLSGVSVALNYLKTKTRPAVSDTNMWAETSEGCFKGDSESRTSNWNNRSRKVDGNGQNAYHSGGGNGRDDGRNAVSKGRRNSDRSDSLSSSDESKGRLITKKNIDLPILVDYHYQDLKILSYADILVTHVVNPREFYVQLPESSVKLLPLLEEMTLLYGNSTGCVPVPKMKPSDPCAVLNPEDSFWYRGIVYNMLGHQIEVQLVDYGNVELVPLANVKQLRAQFFQFPVQALKLGLPSVSPPDGKNWPIEAIELFKRKVTDKCLVAQFLESKGKGSYSVNLIDADKLQTESMDQELVSLGLCKLESKQVLPNTLVKGLMIEPLEVPLGSKYTVSITWFKSYSKFFCQIESPPFIKLMEDIQAHYGSLLVLDGVVERPLPNTYCVTQFSEDQCWYRAHIMTTKRNKVALFYVDYGNCDEVNRKFVKNIKKGFEKIPKQAILCYLKGVDSNETPSPEALEKIYGGTLTCHFLDKKDDGYLVEVFSDGVSVSQALVSTGLVKSIVSKPPTVYMPIGTEIKSPFIKISLQEGEYEVIVIYTESSQRFYCQKAEASIQIEELMECIMRHFTENQIAASQVEIGLAYVAKYSADDRWYRAVVLSVTETEAEVKFIDYGNVELVPKTMISECTPELLESCPEFLELPEQAFECCLYGVPENIDENLDNLFCDTVDNKELVINVRKKIGGIHLVSILDKSGQINEDVGLKIFGASLPYPQGYPPVTMPSIQCEVYISHIDSINSFYIQLKSEEDSLAAIVEDLTLLENRGPILSNPAPGSACCTQYSEDGIWYRAVILSVENELATVQFVDYGNTDICNLSTGSVTVPINKLIKIPPIAFKCALKDYQVSPDSLDELTDQFTEVTGEKLLSAKFYSSNFPLQVELFDEGVNVADKFLLTNISVPSRTIPAPEPTKATAYQPAKVATGSNVIYVSHIDSVNSFYVQLVSQTPVLDQMMEDLTLIAPEAAIKVENAHPGTICIAPYSEDGAFYRAIVVEVAGDNCKVRFVDYGNCDVVPTSNLLVPPLNLLFQSLLATECTLNNFQAISGREIEAVTQFHTLVEDKEIIGEFLSADLPVKIDLVFEGQKISQILKQEGLIEEIKINLTPVSKPESSKITHLTNELDSYPPWFFPPLTDAIPMNLSHITALDKFYLQLWEKTDEISELRSALNEFYTNDGLIVDEIFAGMPCVAQFTEDESWYRAEIKSFVGGEVTVFFVDYGNDDIVSLDKIKHITKEFISTPPYAVECQFKRLSPCTYKMEKEVVEQISELTFERKLIVKFSTLTEMPYDVELTIDGEDMPLSEKLIFEGLARVIKTTATEFLLPVYIPSTRSQVYVSHANSPESFFLTLQRHENNVFFVVKRINDYCSRPKATPLDSIACGTACGSLYSLDGAWYRAKVLETDGTSATVKFIDYGNVDVTAIESLKSIRDDITLLPPFAFECKLKGLKTIPGLEEEAFNLFQTLTLNEKLCATFHSSQEPVEVKLYHGEFLPQNDVSSKLLTMGLMTEEGKLDEPGPAIKESIVEELTESKTSDKQFIHKNLDNIKPTETELLPENLDNIKPTETELLPENLDKIELIDMKLVPDYFTKSEPAAKESFAELKLDSEEEQIHGSFEEPELVDKKIISSGEELKTEEDTLVDDTSSYLSTSKEISTECVITPSFTDIDVPLKHKVHTLVSHSVSPTEFYLNLMSESMKLEDMMTKLTEMYTSLASNEMIVDEIIVGQACVCLYLDDLHWYRCKVIDVFTDEVSVQFVDVGNTVRVNKRHVMKIQPDLLLLPTQSIKSSLHGVLQLEGDTEWSHKVCDELTSIFEKDGEARVFLTEFIDKIEDKVTVKLLDIGISVADILEEKGLVQLEREVQFPSVSSTDQVDQSILEEDSPIVRMQSLESKIVPGTIAMGRVAIEEEIRDKVEQEELRKVVSHEDKPVPGFVTYLETEEVFCTSPDDDFDYSNSFNIEESQNRIVVSSPTLIPRPLSREDKILPGLLSRGLMEEEQRILELQEAEEKTPKGHDEKILPGILHRDENLESSENGLSESSKEERISDESFPSDISSVLSESTDEISEPQTPLNEDISASVPSEPIPAVTSKSKIQPEISVNGSLVGNENIVEPDAKEDQISLCPMSDDQNKKSDM